MDAKEAIKVVKSIKQATQDYYDRHKGFYDTADAKEDVEKELAGINVAISALEKQVPKVPIDYKCPCCGESVFLETRAGWYQVEHHLKVCENCGQKIIWNFFLCNL